MGALITCIGFILAHLQPPVRSTRKSQTTLVVAGSETLRPLLSACAKSYASTHPGVRIVVRGGGSAIGVASLLAGQIDLALSSRELSSAELNVKAPSGEPRAIPIAREGIALIAHPAVRIRSLDMDQLAALFAGEISEWSALGADKTTVVVIGRAAGSGTAAVVQERVLGRRFMTPNAQLKDSHEEVIRAVAVTKGAIGYADAHLARAPDSRVQIIPLRESADGSAYLPEPGVIVSGHYPLARSLYLVAMEPIAEPVRSLADHCTGAAGRQLIEAAGFLPVLAAQPRRRAWAGSASP